MSHYASRLASLRCFAEALEPRRLLSAGDLDPTFGDGGKVSLTTVFQDVGLGADLAVQPDGKIVAVGSTDSTGVIYSVVVARFNRDGALDASFGSGDGMVVFRAFKASQVELQPDGKIVVGVQFNRSFFGVARLDPDGALDASFGENGIAVAEAPAENLSAMALQPDGKIVLGGNVYVPEIGRYDYDFAIARFTADGHPDPTFGGGGVVKTDFAKGDDTVQSLTVLTDGRIVAAGPTSGYVGGMACFNPDGSLDPSFGVDGKLAPDANSPAYSAFAVAATDDGRFLSAGWDHRDGGHFAAARHLPDGSLDSSFYENGVTAGIDASGVTHVGVHPRADGTLFLSGYVFPQAGSTRVAAALVKITPDGDLDPTFGEGQGYLEQNLPTAGPNFYSVALAPDDRLASIDFTGEPGDYTLSFSQRLNIHVFDDAGRPDSTFGGTGKVSITVPHGSHDVTHDIAIQPDGKVVLAGTTATGPVDWIYGGAIVRFNADGSLDAGFGVGGVGAPDYNPDFSEQWHAVAVQRDRKLLIGGAYVDGSNQPSRLLARLNSDGSIDTTFGVGGFVTAGRGDITKVAVVNDGRILALGIDSFARYLPDGRLDTSFGVGGVVTTAPFRPFASKFAVLPDGRFYYLLTASQNPSNRSLYRFNADGTLDATFGSGGEAGVWSLNIPLLAMAVDGAGRVVVAGGRDDPFSDPTQPTPVVAARFLPTGELDSTFGAADGRISGLDWKRTTVDAVALEPSGKIVIGASGPKESNAYDPASDWRLARLNIDGSLDDSFGVNGRVQTDFDGDSDFLSDLAVLPDGSILASGSAWVRPDRPVWRKTQDFALARYRSGAPQAGAGGPYMVVEGGQVALDASSSAPGDGAIAGYEWDFDYDGIDFNVDAVGVAPTFSAGGLDGPSTRVVAVRTRGDDGGVSVATAEVTITNAAPTLLGVTPTTLLEANRTVLNLNVADASDADRAAGFQFSCDFDGDGVFDLVDVPANAVAVPAAAIPDGPAAFSMRLRVRDRDGAFNDYPLDFNVSNVSPAGSLSAPSTIEAGSTAVVRYVNVREPSAADLASLRFSFDFDNDGVFDVVGDSQTVVVPARYLVTPGSHVIRGKIEDKDGGSARASITITSLVPQTSLRPDADAFVRGGAYQWNQFGADSQLYVRNGSIDDNRMRAFFHFNLTGLRKITSAKLRLHGLTSGTAMVAVHASPDRRPWAEDSLTWNAQLPIDLEPLDTQTLTGTTRKLYEWDVSDYLKTLQAAGATGVTLAVQAVGEPTPLVTLSSKEDVAANRPELLVLHDIPSIAPVVAAVMAAGSTWTDGFLEHIHSIGIGDAADGYILDGTSAAAAPSWANLDRISVRFDLPVQLARGDLRVRGVRTGEFGVAAYHYNDVTHTATWTLAQPLPADRFRLELPSGWTASFAVVPGDVDHSAVVNAADLVKTRNRIGRTIAQQGTGSSAYDASADVNGDGSINASDLVLVRNRIGGALPATPPLFSIWPITWSDDLLDLNANLLD